MRFLFIVGVFCLACCNPKLEIQSSDVLYFDLKSLIAQQAKALTQAQPKVQKFIRHDKQRENHSLTVGSWEQELKVFEEANLNRPIYKDLYTVSDSVAQDTKFRVFTAKKKDLQVRYMRLAYQKEHLQSLEATMLIENVLYHSEKQLRLVFKPNDVLSNYSVKGKFAVVYGTKYDYEIDAMID